MSAAELCCDHPDEIVGRYHLGPVLRRSPGCCSHRAVDRLLRRTVSVTLVGRDGSVGLTLPEQSWLGRSPEVAEVYDGGSWRGRLFLVTQHPEAATLAETTPPGGLPVGEVRDLGLAVATALAPLHRRGRSHGGLGPGTVAWSARGAAFSDVGLLPWLARWSDVPLDPPYPAPEGDASPAADVHALGRLLGELAPRTVPGALRALLTAMTAADPAARPSVEDVAERLRTLSVPSRRRLGALGAHGRRALVVAAAALLLATGVGLGALAGGTDAGAASAFAAADPTHVPGVPLPPVVAAPALPALPSAPVEVEEPVAPRRTAAAVARERHPSEPVRSSGPSDGGGEAPRALTVRDGERRTDRSAQRDRADRPDASDRPVPADSDRPAPQDSDRDSDDRDSDDRDSDDRRSDDAGRPARHLADGAPGRGDRQAVDRRGPEDAAASGAHRPERDEDVRDDLA